MATWDWDVRREPCAGPREPSRSSACPRRRPGTAEAYLALVHEEDRRRSRRRPCSPPWRAGRAATRSGIGWSIARARCRWIEAYGRVDPGRAGASGPDAGRHPRRQRAAARPRAEREELIRELEAKNAELEQFTYTVSHDLKSPLVTIKGFLGLIAKDVDEGRTEQAARGRRAHDERRGDSMQHLLHELLRLSRIGRVVNPLGARALRGGRARGRRGSCGRGSRSGVRRLVIDDDLPVVYGDRLRLVEVAQNLLENAAKFVGDQPSPVVRVGVRAGASGPPRRAASSRTTGSGSTPASTRRSSASSRSSTRAPRAAGWGSPSSAGSSRSTAGAPGSSRPAAATARPSASRCPFRHPASPAGWPPRKEPSMRILRKILKALAALLLLVVALAAFLLWWTHPKRPVNSFFVREAGAGTSQVHRHPPRARARRREVEGYVDRLLAEMTLQREGPADVGRHAGSGTS